MVIHTFTTKTSDCLPRINPPSEARDPKIRPQPLKNQGKSKDAQMHYLQHFDKDANFLTKNKKKQ